MDGNKRTARITSNALLIAYGYCPLSFRTVDSIDYKKAMLIFYEQNNLHAFKQIFISQYWFYLQSKINLLNITVLQSSPYSGSLIGELLICLLNWRSVEKN